MADHREEVGVLILRVEPHSEGLLITVRFDPDVRGPGGEKTRRFTDAESALREVRGFLGSFHPKLRRIHGGA